MLRGRELDVLDVLMRDAGRVLSRTRIAEAVWGLDADPESNVVDQSISRLRSTIDRPFGLRDIQTVRGAGYRICDSATHRAVGCAA